MFKRDQQLIESWAGLSDRNTLDVGAFVLLTIKSQFSGVGNALAKVRSGDAGPLWGWKHLGYEYLHEHRKYYWKRAREAREGRIWINDLMRDYLRVPGLGLPKAGFAVQLLTGEAGCMDMHNLERLGMQARDFTIPKRRDPDDQLRVIDECIENYLYVCAQAGGSAKLWDDWCEYVGDLYSVYDDADDVSRRHVTFLLGE